MTVNQTHANKEPAIKKAVAAVEWQDLRQLTRGQIAYNVILPYPFLLLSWWFTSQSWYVLACGASYCFLLPHFAKRTMAIIIVWVQENVQPPPYYYCSAYY